MSPRLEILCLANSRKVGGRCVAGLAADRSGWVRPLGTTESGALSPLERRLDDRSDPALLDVISVPVGKRVPEPHQPENRAYARGGWRLVRRTTFPAAEGFLRAHTHDGSPLFGNTGDRVEFSVFERNPARYSLALVFPDEVAWFVGVSFRGSTQVRARFSWGRTEYDFGVTDLEWFSKVSALGKGWHKTEALGFPTGQKFMLTVSLGEPAPFDECCYKLVAAVIPIPLGK